MRVEFSAEGIFLPDLRLWLDPSKDTEAAWLSHAHSDHAGFRHSKVIATPETLAFYGLRFPDADFEARALPYGESMEWNGGRLTAYPSAHILGAAQLLAEHAGERLLFTGDIKLRAPLCGCEAAPVRAEHLIIESTFGLPIFHFLTREEARGRILNFVKECFAQGSVPAFLAHPLGRGQEVLNVLCEAGIPTAVHGALLRYLPVYERGGFAFPGWTPYDGLDLKGKALLTVHGFRRNIEASGKDIRIAYVSGWAALDNARARTGAEELIRYSDHADFEELLELVAATGARGVDVVHGYAEPFSHILNQRGIRARAQPAPFPRGAAVRAAEE